MLKGHQESLGPIYTRSSFSGGSSSCRYSKSESNSQEVASQKSKDTDTCIRSSSSSQSNPESDSQTSRISQNCIDFKEVAIPFDKVDDNKDKLLVITDVVYSKFLKDDFTLIFTFGLIFNSSST